MIAEDLESLARIIGTDTVPPAVLTEYKIRLNMFHRNGAGGAIGTAALVDIVRFCGLKPPDPKPRPEEFKWEMVSGNGTAGVEVAIGNGKPLTGAFRGFSSYGVLVVELDGDPVYREFPRNRVRYTGKREPPKPVAQTPEVPKAKAKTSEPPVKKVKAKAKPEEEPEPEPEQATEPPDVIPPVVGGETDWKKVGVGAEVWVETEDDVVDGLFVAVKDDGTIEVEATDGTVVVPAERVRVRG